jgi:acyl carrier protein
MNRPDRDVLRQRLQQVFREVFDDDRIIIEEGTTAEDIDEWDSLTHITLIVAAEKEFGLRLNAAEVGKLANVGALLDILVVRSTR